MSTGRLRARVWLVSDREIFRAAIASLLARQGEIMLAGSSGGDQPLPSFGHGLDDGVCLIDWPPLGDRTDGTDAASYCRSGLAAVASGRLPHERWVALVRADGLGSTAEAVRAGATGVVHEGEGVEELLRAVLRAAEGRRYVSPALFPLVSPGQDAAGRGLPAPLESLSDREREVLGLLAGGQSAQEIAAELGVSSKTVDAHRRNLTKKLQITTLQGLTRFAAQQGLIAVDAAI